MDYHQNARLTIHSRELLARKVLLEKATLKLAAASFNVSAKTAAKWGAPLPGAGTSRSQGSQLAFPSIPAWNSIHPVGKGSGSSPPALEWLAYCTGTLSQPGDRQPHPLPRWPQPLTLARPASDRYPLRTQAPGDLIHFDIKRLARIVKPGHRIHGDRGQRSARRGLRVSPRRHR